MGGGGTTVGGEAEAKLQNVNAKYIMCAVNRGTGANPMPGVD